MVDHLPPRELLSVLTLLFICLSEIQRRNRSDPSSVLFQATGAICGIAALGGFAATFWCHGWLAGLAALAVALVSAVLAGILIAVAVGDTRIVQGLAVIGAWYTSGRLLALVFGAA